MSRERFLAITRLTKDVLFVLPRDRRTFQIRSLYVTDHSQTFENFHNLLSLFNIFRPKFSLRISKLFLLKIAFFSFQIFEFESVMIDDGSAKDDF